MMTDLTDRFAICLHATLAWEGGWSDHPRDTGGKTNQGIIFREWCAWHHQEVPEAGDQSFGPLVEAFRQMDDETRDTIYRVNYWQPARCSELPPGVDLLVFDAAVNVGVSKAVRWLQKVLGAAEDGHLGVQTMASVHRASPLNIVSEYSKLREDFYRACKEFRTFGVGWLNRTESIRRQADATVHGGGSMGMALGLAKIANDASITPQRTPKAIQEPPTTNPAQSTTVWAAASVVLGGLVTLVQTLAQMMAALVQAGKNAGDLHLAAASAPVEFFCVLIGVSVVAGGAYVLAERIRKAVLA